MASLRSQTGLNVANKENDKAKVVAGGKASLQPRRLGKAATTASSSRAVLGEIANKAAPRPALGASRKPALPAKAQALKKPAAAKKETEVSKKEVEAAAEEEKTEETAPEVEAKEEEAAAAETEALPEGIPDVDTADFGNTQLCSEYARSIYAYLRQLEAGLVIKKDFLKGCSINARMRGVVVDWLIEVHTQFKMLQETLYITIYMLDRYLQVEGLTMKKSQLQLVGVTAMFIASKVEEMYAPEITDFVYITDGAYTVEEIKATELKMLQSLNFNVSRPLPLHFLRRNSKAGDVDMMQHGVAKFVMEVCLTEYDLAHHPPSLIAAAALLLSLRVLQPETPLATAWSSTLSYYSTYTARQLVPLVQRMAAAVVKAIDTKAPFKAVTLKYKAKKYLGVSDLPELRGEVMEKLARKEPGM